MGCFHFRQQNYIQEKEEHEEEEEEEEEGQIDNFSFVFHQSCIGVHACMTDRNYRKWCSLHDGGSVHCTRVGALWQYIVIKLVRISHFCV